MGCIINVRVRLVLFLTEYTADADALCANALGAFFTDEIWNKGWAANPDADKNTSGNPIHFDVIMVCPLNNKVAQIEFQCVGV